TGVSTSSGRSATPTAWNGRWPATPPTWPWSTSACRRPSPTRGCGPRSACAAGIGYLLKDRVADVADFVEALVRVASGGTALDPEVVTQLMGASRRTTALARLSAREREVLALMAEGRTNSAIATSLVVSEGALEKHVANIFAKLDISATANDHRRILAVLRYLEG